MPSNHWHTQSVSAVLKALKTSEQGLSSTEAGKRQKEYGPNALPEGKRDTIVAIFFRQWVSPLIFLLLGAAVVVLLLGHYNDAIIIFVVLLFNAVVGSIQEGKAEKSLRALRKFAQTQAIVRRDGKEHIIADTGVVPGDMLVLHEGDKVSADARLLVASSLRVDESALTGESEPVEKNTTPLRAADLPAAEQKNMLLKGTQIVGGEAMAVAVAIGRETFIGKIAVKMTAVDTEIPLKENIRHLSRVILYAVAAMSAALFAAGIVAGKPIPEMFLTVVALAVSVIPEGLPIVTTLVLATGVARMSKRHALVKRLQAVEALGQARVIAVDKTGTITRNELMVERVAIDGEMFTVTGAGYEPTGDISLGDMPIEPASHPNLLHIGKLAAWVSNGHAVYDEKDTRWRVLGDPTEAALTVLAEKLGFHKEILDVEFPKVAELPFDSRTRYHATVHQANGRALLSVVGAPEVVLGFATNRAPWIDKAITTMSRSGLRVLALGTKDVSGHTLRAEDVRDVSFVGLIGMRDELRAEVPEALRRAREAGIRVVMITGDHKTTAEAIARDAGIYRPGDTVVTGAEIEALDAPELIKRLNTTSVFARVSPEHKLRIIEAYRARGEVIAMTGDGVNDALSLTAADLGVAMGNVGTEVAKEAADIVLLDDNFGSIVSAVEEGRSIYKTIKKVILYLFSTGAGEAMTITAAIFMGLPLPVLPAQIIWLNLVTDGFLDVALSQEPKEDGLLQGNFERPKKYLFDRLMGQRLVLMAVTMMIGTLSLFLLYYPADGLPKAMTVSLTILAVFQWFNAWNCRHEEKSVFQMNPFGNPWLVAATATIIILHLFAVYHPLLQGILRTVPLSARDWLVIIPIAASIIVVEELRKLATRVIHRPGL